MNKNLNKLTLDSKVDLEEKQSEVLESKVESDGMLTKSDKEETEVKLKEIYRKPRRKLLDKTGPLTCRTIPGKHLRWINLNEPGNMYWAEGQRYTPVRPDEQDLSEFERSQDSKSTGSDIRRTGKDGVTLMLMKQDQEDYEDAIKEITEENQRQITAFKAKGSEAIGTFGKTVEVNQYNIKKE